MEEASYVCSRCSSAPHSLYTGVVDGGRRTDGVRHYYAVNLPEGCGETLRGISACLTERVVARLVDPPDSPRKVLLNAAPVTGGDNRAWRQHRGWGVSWATKP